jgi:hypothetical protein
MLLTANDLTLIARNRTAVVFRRWVQPAARTDQTLQTAVGFISIEAVDAVTLADIVAADAGAAGYADLETLRSALGPDDEGPLYRIRLRLVEARPDLN